MSHWHRYAKAWAAFVLVVILVYVLGSPVYLWARGSSMTLEIALATMGYAAIGAGVVGIPLLGLGAAVIAVVVRVGNHRRNRGHHAA